MDIPFNKDNCSPNCFLLMEGYFKGLLAYSAPISLYLHSDVTTSLKSLSSYIINKPVCESCTIP